MGKKEKSYLFSRILRKLCRPIVKLDKRLEKSMEVKHKKWESEQESPAFSKVNLRDPFFADIGVISHAGGGMQGLDYLNCVEGFPYYYEKGNRVFEYDVDRLSTGEFVLTHEADFVKGEKIDSRFQPLELDALLDIIREHTDIRVIMDCKFRDLRPFAAYVKEYLKDESILNRIVIQVFNEENILQVKSVYDFKVLHVCLMASDYNEIAKRCVKYKIGAVSIAEKAIRERSGWQVFDKNNICAFVYSINTLKEFAT